MPTFTSAPPSLDHAQDTTSLDNVVEERQPAAYRYSGTIMSPSTTVDHSHDIAPFGAEDSTAPSINYHINKRTSDIISAPPSIDHSHHSFRGNRSSTYRLNDYMTHRISIPSTQGHGHNAMSYNETDDRHTSAPRTMELLTESVASPMTLHRSDDMGQGYRHESSYSTSHRVTNPGATRLSMQSMQSAPTEADYMAEPAFRYRVEDGRHYSSFVDDEQQGRHAATNSIDQLVANRLSAPSSLDHMQDTTFFYDGTQDGNSPSHRTSDPVVGFESSPPSLDHAHDSSTLDVGALEGSRYITRRASGLRSHRASTLPTLESIQDEFSSDVGNDAQHTFHWTTEPTQTHHVTTTVHRTVTTHINEAGLSHNVVNPPRRIGTTYTSEPEPTRISIGSIRSAPSSLGDEPDADLIYARGEESQSQPHAPTKPASLRRLSKDSTRSAPSEIDYALADLAYGDARPEAADILVTDQASAKPIDNCAPEPRHVRAYSVGSPRTIPSELGAEKPVSLPKDGGDKRYSVPAPVEQPNPVRRSSRESTRSAPSELGHGQQDDVVRKNYEGQDPVLGSNGRQGVPPTTTPGVRFEERPPPSNPAITTPPPFHRSKLFINFLIIAAYITGAVVAIGHHFFLAVLNNNDVADYSQFWIKNASNTFAQVVSIALGLAITLSITEGVWKLIKKETMSEDVTSDLFTLPSTASILACMRRRWKLTLIPIVFLAIIYQLLAILSMFAPNALTVGPKQNNRDVPVPQLNLSATPTTSTDLFNLIDRLMLTSPADQWDVPALCGSACSFEIEYQAPGVSCRDLRDDEISLSAYDPSLLQTTAGWMFYESPYEFLLPLSWGQNDFNLSLSYVPINAQVVGALPVAVVELYDIGGSFCHFHDKTYRAAFLFADGHKSVSTVVVSEEASGLNEQCGWTNGGTLSQECQQYGVNAVSLVNGYTSPFYGSLSWTSTGINNNITGPFEIEHIIGFTNDTTTGTASLNTQVANVSQALEELFANVTLGALLHFNQTEIKGVAVQDGTAWVYDLRILWALYAPALVLVFFGACYGLYCSLHDDTAMSRNFSTAILAVLTVKSTIVRNGQAAWNKEDSAHPSNESRSSNGARARTRSFGSSRSVGTAGETSSQDGLDFTRSRQSLAGFSTDANTGSSSRAVGATATGADSSQTFGGRGNRSMKAAGHSGYNLSSATGKSGSNRSNGTLTQQRIGESNSRDLLGNIGTSQQNETSTGDGMNGNSSQSTVGPTQTQSGDLLSRNRVISGGLSTILGGAQSTRFGTAGNASGAQGRDDTAGMNGEQATSFTSTGAGTGIDQTNATFGRDTMTAADSSPQSTQIGTTANGSGVQRGNDFMGMNSNQATSFAGTVVDHINAAFGRGTTTAADSSTQSTQFGSAMNGSNAQGQGDATGRNGSQANSSFTGIGVNKANAATFDRGTTTAADSFGRVITGAKQSSEMLAHDGASLNRDAIKSSESLGSFSLTQGRQASGMRSLDTVPENGAPNSSNNAAKTTEGADSQDASFGAKFWAALGFTQPEQPNQVYARGAPGDRNFSDSSVIVHTKQADGTYPRPTFMERNFSDASMNTRQSDGAHTRPAFTNRNFSEASVTTNTNQSNGMYTQSDDALVQSNGQNRKSKKQYDNTRGFLGERRGDEDANNGCESKDRSRNGKVTMKQRIATWFTEIFMILSIIIALILALGHHAMLSRINGHSLGSTSDQFWIRNAGNAFAHAVVVCLGTTIGISLTQACWRAIKLMGLRIKAIDDMFALPSPKAIKALLRSIRAKHALYLILIVIVMEGLIVVSILAPNALSVGFTQPGPVTLEVPDLNITLPLYDGLITQWDDLIGQMTVDVPANTWNVPPGCGNNCSFEVVYNAPALSCRDLLPTEYTLDPFDSSNVVTLPGTTTTGVEWTFYDMHSSLTREEDQWNGQNDTQFVCNYKPMTMDVASTSTITVNYTAPHTGSLCHCQDGTYRTNFQFLDNQKTVETTLLSYDNSFSSNCTWSDPSTLSTECKNYATNSLHICQSFRNSFSGTIEWKVNQTVSTLRRPLVLDRILDLETNTTGHDIVSLTPKFANLSVGLVELFSNMTSNLLPGLGGNTTVTVMSWDGTPVWKYSAVTLWSIYGSALFLALVIVIYGMYCIHMNGMALDRKVSTLIMVVKSEGLLDDDDSASESQSSQRNEKDKSEFNEKGGNQGGYYELADLNMTTIRDRLHA